MDTAENNMQSVDFKIVLDRLQALVTIHNTKTGQYKYVSCAAQQLLGYSADTVREKGIGFTTSLIHPDDVEQVLSKSAEAKQKAEQKRKTTVGTPLASFDYRIRHNSGRWVWLHADVSVFAPDSSGHISELLNVSFDITDRKNIEAKLHAQHKELDKQKAIMDRLEEIQAQYHALFSSSAVGVFLHNKEGRIIESNDAFLGMVGYSNTDLRRGKLAVSRLTHPKYIQLDAQKMHNLYTTGKATPWEKEYVRKDGSYLPVLLSKVMIPHSDGKFIVIVIDTTDRQELIALNNAKDDFISLASHQLRTPATGVKQYIGMLLEGFAGKVSEPAQITMLKTAYENNERQLNIIDDLLKVANVDAGKVHLDLETTDIVQLLRETIQDQIIKFKERNQKVRLTYDCETLPAKIDQRRFRMVIENIIDNASKYTSSNRVITVAVLSRKNKIIIDVHDQGVGIDKKDIGKLFQKFSRIENPLSREVGGTGLGLYWAKRIVDLHNGDVTVTSKPGKGSTFHISLPHL